VAAYHQLGHHSESMVLEEGLSAFGGVVLSPVNYSPEDTVQQCARFRSHARRLDIIFDPQLYVLASGRGRLPDWRHMPSDFATADQSSLEWWRGVLEDVTTACLAFAPDGICSPVPFPQRGFQNAHYGLAVEIANALEELLRGEIQRPIATALVGLQDLGREDRYLEVGSLLTRFRGESIYLVFCDDTLPRRERTDSAAIEAALRLIKLLV